MLPKSYVHHAMRKPSYVELTLPLFHIAKAFDAPMLRSVNSAAGTQGVLEKLGDAQLRPGVVEAAGCDYTCRLGLGEMDQISEPTKEQRFADQAAVTHARTVWWWRCV
jgi:hypothetical protein